METLRLASFKFLVFLLSALPYLLVISLQWGKKGLILTLVVSISVLDYPLGPETNVFQLFPPTLFSHL